MSWEGKALCAGHPDPEWFFAEPGTEADAAKEVCQRCPVRRECALSAIDGGKAREIRGGFDVYREWKNLCAWAGVRPKLKPLRTCADCGVDFRSVYAAAKCIPCRSDLVDVEPVRQHVRTLQAAGMSCPKISVAAGLNHQYVTTMVMRAALRTMRRKSAEAILAVPVPQAVDA